MINNDYLDHFLEKDNKESYNTHYNDFIIVINSKDCDHNLDTSYNFSINFNSLVNSNLNINTDFKNIIKIEIIDLFIPNIYVNQKEVISLYNKSFITSNDTGIASNPIKLKRISDIPYILLSKFNTYVDFVSSLLEP